MTATPPITTTSGGTLVELGGTSWYRIDQLERMDPFLVSVMSNSDLWLFASSAGSLTLGRVDADNALLPYETDDRLHRAAGITGPVTVITRGEGAGREVWRPFGADVDPSAHRALAKSTVGNQLFFEETHGGWGLTFRVTWSPAPHYGWVRSIELIDESGAGQRVRVLDGLIDVMPSGIGSAFESAMSNLADAYKRAETGRWGSAAIYTLESRITDTAQPAESLSANVVWSFGDAPAELLLDERAVRAEVEGRAWPATDLLFGRRGSYLRRGEVVVTPNGTTSWSLVGDTCLDHARVLDCVAIAQHPGAADLVGNDVRDGTAQLRRFLAGSDGFQSTGDPVADAHHLSNVMSNSMRGGLLPYGMSLPIDGFIDHLETWNLPAFRAYAETIEAGGDAEQLVSELGLEFQEGGEFGRLGTITGLGADREVIDAALALDAGQWGGPLETDLGAVLFEVTNRTVFDRDEFEKEKAAARARRENERLNQLTASLIELRRRDLTPKYGAQVLAAFDIEPPDAS